MKICDLGIAGRIGMAAGISAVCSGVLVLSSTAVANSDAVPESVVEVECGAPGTFGYYNGEGLIPPWQPWTCFSGSGSIDIDRHALKIRTGIYSGSYTYGPECIRTDNFGSGQEIYLGDTFHMCRLTLVEPVNQNDVEVPR